MGFFSKRPRNQDLGTMDGNPSALDAVEDLPLVAKADLALTGGLPLIGEGAEVATGQDIGRDLQDDIDQTDDTEEHLFDEVGAAAEADRASGGDPATASGEGSEGD